MKENDLKNLPIGVIDSGVGGLSVLKWLQEKMPHENFLYIGDTARCPYGNAYTEEEIYEFSAQMVLTLGKKGIKALVVACNTISMLGKESLRFGYDFPIITMSKGANLLLSASKNKQIGIFATPFTISKELHRKAILEKDPEAKVTMVACPDFVPLIEGEKFDSLNLRVTIGRYCQELRKNDCDTLLLACTHYPFVRKEIEREMQGVVTIVDPAEQTTLDVIEALGKDLLKDKGEGKSVVCCTANISKMRRLAEKMLDLNKCEFMEIKLVDL